MSPEAAVLLPPDSPSAPDRSAPVHPELLSSVLPASAVPDCPLSIFRIPVFPPADFQESWQEAAHILSKKHPDSDASAQVPLHLL